MKVVLLTLTYPPEPANQLYELMAKLHSFYSCETSVITSTPSYPIGKLYPGYKNKFNSSFENGTKVYRGPVFPSQSKNLLHRSLYYLSNFISSIAILLFRKSHREEIYIVYQPPVSTFLSFYVFSLIKKRKFVFWINDMWPETLINYGLKNKLFISVINLIYKRIYTKASKIIVLSPGFKNLLIDKGISQTKIDIVYNWYSGESHNKILNSVFDEDFKLVYAGNLGKFQKIETAIYAVCALKKQGYNIRFDIYGAGTEYDNLTLLVEKLDIDNIIALHGRIHYEEVKDKLLAADALFVQLIPNDLFSRTIPHKIYEYMSVSKPILAAVNGDAAYEVQIANCGVVCEPDSVSSIEIGLVKLINLSKEERNLLGENGRKFVVKERNIDSACMQFHSIIKSIY